MSPFTEKLPQVLTGWSGFIRTSLYSASSRIKRVQTLCRPSRKLRASGRVNSRKVDGVTVETTGGVWVEMNGDLTLLNDGYYSGTLSSGARAACADFCGLHLSDVLTGMIVCHTGAPYDKGNGEPVNFKRWYEITNVSSDLTVDISISTLMSGSHDERVRVVIYNIRGELVRRLMDDQISTGTYLIVWDGIGDDGRCLTSGVYFCKMVAGAFSANQKLTLSR